MTAAAAAAAAEEQQGEEERWAKHYSSFHRILLVGEGDFSFSLSLAKSFGSGSNIVASSRDSYDFLIMAYKESKSNLETLEKMGASLLHGVDATNMRHHTDLKMKKFDRIIFNFPHAGFHGKENNDYVIMMHQDLVRGFFKNARGMLQPNGEIHVNHKTTAPFCNWNLEKLAAWNSLALVEHLPFKIEDYPDYKNKKGAGSECDKAFPLGECSTFKFRFSKPAKQMTSVRNNLYVPQRRNRKPQEIQNYVPHQQPSLPEIRLPNTHFMPYQQPETSFMPPQQPTVPQFRQPETNNSSFMNGIPGSVGPPAPTWREWEFSRASGGHRSFLKLKETQTYMPQQHLNGPEYRRHETNYNNAYTNSNQGPVGLQPSSGPIWGESSRTTSGYLKNLVRAFGRSDHNEVLSRNSETWFGTRHGRIAKKKLGI